MLALGPSKIFMLILNVGVKFYVRSEPLQWTSLRRDMACCKILHPHKFACVQVLVCLEKIP